jgi:DNA-binding MarR family transcriptional regulator
MTAAALLAPANPSSPNGLAPNLSGVNRLLLRKRRAMSNSSKHPRVRRAGDGAVARIEVACRQAVAGKLAARALARWVDGFGVSETEFRLLWQLFVAAESPELRPCTLFDQAELAVRLAASPAQVSGVVERLRSLTLIERDAQPGDRRRQLWRIAPAGRTLVLAVVAAVGSQPHVGPAGKDAA